MIETVIGALKKHRFSLVRESDTQREIGQVLLKTGISFIPEYKLDEKNRIDFLIEGFHGLEVKIKGSPADIYKQCVRYCHFEKIKNLILVTNKSMGVPSEIGGKPVYVVLLGRSWL
jgi:hypothetical protein